MEILLEEELSFTTCMRDIAPNIRNMHLGNGVEVLVWENARHYQKYEEVFPEELQVLARQITTAKNDRILFVCDSENMIRKAVLYYAMQKHRMLHQEAMKNNRPLKGEQAKEIPEVMAGLVDLRVEKDVQLRLWKNLENLDEWHSVYGYRFKVDGESPGDDFIWEILFGKRECNMLLGVSREEYLSGRVAQLICEGGYRPVFLPVEPEGYYLEVAQKLLIQPAFIQHILDSPGEAEMEYEELWEQNDYLNLFGTEDLEKALSVLRERRGRLFCERDIAVLFERTREAGCSLLDLLHGQRRKTYQELQQMNGFIPIKELVKHRLALFRERKHNPKLKILGQHYLFEGNPGTGKTEGARLMHEVLSGAGFLTGDFVVADRQDIVGSYVGQTAPKVAKLFDRALGGTLFVDEAGFFLQKQSGGFIQEAIKEFVRYMECRRDVTVIFAVYPGEKAEFMALDPGLSSRIDQVVTFADHDEELLCEIGAAMWKEQGYVTAENVQLVLKEFLREQREKSRKSFGNGRAVRRLVELSIQEAALRHMEMESETENDREENLSAESVVTLEDLQKAMRIVENMSEVPRFSTVGFCIKNADKREQAIPFAAACQVQ